MRTLAKLTSLIGLAGCLVALVSADAKAQASRTFVSGQGTDSNACTLAAPCRTFARSVAQTNAGGEVTVLDSAGYGAVTITQSITINNPGGVEAGVTAANGQTAITINTTAPADVTLRGLTLQGGGVGLNGIDVISTLPLDSGYSSLNIIDCVVKNFTGNGIVVEPKMGNHGQAAPILNVMIADSFSLNNGTTGIAILATGPGILASIYRTVANNNATGVNIAPDSSIVQTLIADSHVDNNTSTGISLSDGTAFMKASTAISNHDTDVNIARFTLMYFHNGNTVYSMQNSGSAYSDGSNNIIAKFGNPLTRADPN